LGRCGRGGSARGTAGAKGAWAAKGAWPLPARLAHGAASWAPNRAASSRLRHGGAMAPEGMCDSGIRRVRRVSRPGVCWGR